MSKINKITFCLILLITISFLNISCSKKVITGEYRTNFNSYGRYSKTLTLDCEGNAIMNFNGDIFLNNNSFGVWKKDKDTLIIFFDSVINQNNRYKGEIKFLIKRNRLEYMPFSKSKYKELVKYAEDNNITNIPNYKKINKASRKMLKNFTGKSKHQYFKKIENIKCAK